MMEKAKGIGCGCAIAAVMVFLLAVVLIALGIAVAVNGQDEMSDGRPPFDIPPNKTWVAGHGGEDDPQVIHIELKGTIAPRGDDESFLAAADKSPFECALEEIHYATRDDDVDGILLEIDSPGGTVTESDILSDAIRRFKCTDTNRFVVVLMDGTCCSGGYYVAALADCIVAHPTTLTGSIGVIMQTFNAAELAKKLGVSGVTIASGENKALLDPLAPVDPEHVELLKRPVTHDYERFLEIVSMGRGIPIDELKKIADGRVLSAKDALELKLVDYIGYMEEAIAASAAIANAHDVRVYRYTEPSRWERLFE